jgi:hypothetical protein
MAIIIFVKSTRVVKIRLGFGLLEVAGKRWEGY